MAQQTKTEAQRNMHKSPNNFKEALQVYKADLDSEPIIEEKIVNPMKQLTNFLEQHHVVLVKHESSLQAEREQVLELYHKMIQQMHNIFGVEQPTGGQEPVSNLMGHQHRAANAGCDRK